MILALLLATVAFLLPPLPPLSHLHTPTPIPTPTQEVDILGSSSKLFHQLPPAPFSPSSGKVHTLQSGPKYTRFMFPGYTGYSVPSPLFFHPTGRGGKRGRRTGDPLPPQQSVHPIHAMPGASRPSRTKKDKKKAFQSDDYSARICKEALAPGRKQKEVVDASEAKRERRKNKAAHTGVAS